MTWWGIIKQGKILTLPKTKLRIKKPDKVEEERNCKDKLLQYNEKLKKEKSILKTVYDIWQQEDYENAEKWRIREMAGGNLSFSPNDSAWSKNYIIYPSRHNPQANAESVSNLNAAESFWFTDNKHIEDLPEEVCCTMLDLMNSATEQFTDNVTHSGMEGKEVNGWLCRVAFNTHEFVDDSTVTHERVSNLFRIIITHDDADTIRMGWAISAPLDWVYGYDVDWR